MNDLIKVFNNCILTADSIFPPNRDVMEIAPKIYGDFKKLLTQNLGKWRGGKLQCFTFPFNPEKLLSQLKAGETPNYKQDWHYFPTPENVIDQMFQIIIPSGSCKCLEPSAGRGVIVEGINELAGYMANITWDVIEAEPINRGILKEKNLNLIWDDFDTFETDEKYNFIFANPPFKRDWQHVEKMVDLLYINGSAVVVLPVNFESKYKSRIEKWEEKFEDILFYKVKSGSFKGSGTSIDTVIMHLSYKKLDN